MIQDIVKNGDTTGKKTEAVVNSLLEQHKDVKILDATYGPNNINGLDHMTVFKDLEGYTYTVVYESKQVSRAGSVKTTRNAAGDKP